MVPRAVIQSGVGWFYRGLAAKGTHMRAEKQAGQGRREQRIRKGWNTGLCLWKAEAPSVSSANRLT